MKIQVVVYPKTIPWKIQDHLNARLFNESTADVILFPGWSFYDTIQVENFQNLMKNKKTLGFFDLAQVGSRRLTNALFSVYKGQIKFLSFQLFTDAIGINGNRILGQMFLKEFRENRVFRVKGKLVRVIHCGELNILRNEQGNEKDRNKVAFRFQDKMMENEFKSILNDTSLILNPQHSPLGNQGKLSKRREYLSAKGKGYISTSNVAKITELDTVKSEHYAYFNGAEIDRNLVGQGKYFRLYEYEMNFV
jgi:hypothetical protein